MDIAPGEAITLDQRLQETTSDYDREKLEERLAKLAGGVAVIRVGGNSEVEVSPRRFARVSNRSFPKISFRCPA